MSIPTPISGFRMHICTYTRDRIHRWGHHARFESGAGPSRLSICHDDHPRQCTAIHAPTRPLQIRQCSLPPRIRACRSVMGIERHHIRRGDQLDRGHRHASQYQQRSSPTTHAQQARRRSLIRQPTHTAHEPSVAATFTFSPSSYVTEMATINQPDCLVHSSWRR